MPSSRPYTLAMGTDEDLRRLGRAGVALGRAVVVGGCRSVRSTVGMGAGQLGERLGPVVDDVRTAAADGVAVVRRQLAAAWARPGGGRPRSDGQA